MRVLLTGGTGYIGSHIAVVLTQAGHDALLFDNLANSHARTVSRIEQITGARLPFIEGDVRDANRLELAMREHAIDSVVHLAGLKAVGESSTDPLAYYDNNLGGSISLLKAMSKSAVKKLIFSSSATVYGDPKHLPIDELHHKSATNPYARSKLYIEEMLADVARADEGWRTISLRYFNPVGAHDSGLIGEDPTGIPNNLMPYISRVAAGQLPHLNVYGADYDTPDGTGIRDYIHVMDLAEGHLAALAHLDYLRQSFDAINLGTGRGHSVLEVVKAFERASGRSIPCQTVSRRPGDVAACYADPSKAAAVLNWEAKRDLNDMCLSAWRFQCKQALDSQ